MSGSKLITDFILFSPFAGVFYFVIILFWRISYLKKRGIQVTSKKLKNPGTSFLLYPGFIIILLVWLFEIIKSSFQFSFSILPKIFTQYIFENLLLKIFGVVLIILSLIILTTTLIHFNTTLRFGLDKINKGALITDGIFSLSRNPFFLSLDFYFLGVALIFPNLFFIVFAILAIISIHFFILKEEKFMREVYGEGYNRYTEKVRRYF